MRNYFYIFFIFGLLASCEEEVVPDNSDFAPQYVVESYLEKSKDGFPPFLLLTKSIGFYSKIDPKVLQNIFVSGASVKVKLEGIEYRMDELCLSQLPDDVKKEILKNLGLNPDSVNVEICAYIDINHNIPIQSNRTYQLEIIKDQDTIRSQTRIPELVKIDSIWFEDIPGKANDTFAEMYGILNDFKGQSDYYRYFTAGENEGLIPNNSSVFNDFFFDGQEFKFTIPKAREAGEEFNETSGYFRRGDTVRVKWCNIDKAHFEFWNTLEVSRTRQGPFSSYVRIKTNIQNGLGIFGGQNCEVYEVIVK